MLVPKYNLKLQPIKGGSILKGLKITYDDKTFTPEETINSLKSEGQATLSKEVNNLIDKYRPEAQKLSDEANLIIQKYKPLGISIKDLVKRT